MSEHSVYSFDIFDTCLTRLVARPADVFWVLGEKVLAHLGNSKPTPDELTDFRLERMRAEREARAQKSNGEVLLADIYAEFDWLEQRGLDRERGMQAEIETEHDLIRPIAAARERIRRARESGARIVFISDMYLPSMVIGSWLVESGMAAPEDPVYVSGEMGVSKKSGDLFRRVAEKEGLDFRRWRHLGDHPVSDLAAPRKLGIQAERWCPAELTEYEERAYCALGDVVAASRLAGTMRCVRVGGGAFTDQRSISNIQCPRSNVQNSGQGTEGSPSPGPGKDISEVGGPKSVVRPTWNLEPAACNLQPATVSSTKAANGAKGGDERSEDLKLTGERLEAVRSMAADIGAPLLVAFVLFVLRRAREAGVQRLYFLSRRGELPLKIARVFQADYPEIELRYLYSSRWAWRPAAYGRWCRELWDEIVTPRLENKLNAGKILQVLGVESEGFAADFMKECGHLADLESVYAWLSRPEIKAVIERNWHAKRVLLRVYFQQEGIWEKKSIGIVDDGWTGRVQRDLQNLLVAQGGVPELHGFYLGILAVQNSMHHSESGPIHVFLSGAREGSIPGNPVRQLLAHHLVLEEVFLCSNEGFCSGYSHVSGRVVPILRDGLARAQDSFIDAWHQTVLDFARIVSSGNHINELIDRVAIQNAASICQSPPREWVEPLLNQHIAYDVAGAGKLPLAKRLALREIANNRNPLLHDGQLNQYASYWPEGSLAVSSRLVRALALLNAQGWRRFAARVLGG